MESKISELFSSDVGKEILSSVTAMLERLCIDREAGFLIGFSGGPDSVMLLSAMRELRKKDPRGLLAVHVNHCIRGDEADRDEAFSKGFADALGIEFQSLRINVPEIAKECSTGIEETARNARYSAFRDIIKGRSDLRYIAVAHNATDNLETVIFNMMRGSGTKGMSGISPIRDEIIRPLLEVPKRDMVDALDSFGIPYVTDSTNFSVEYTRNYIRHNIIPGLSHLSKNPEKMSSRMTANLRCDDDYIQGVADRFLSDTPVPEQLALAKLHPAVLTRVIKRMAWNSGAEISSIQLAKLRELLLGGSSFSYSLHGGRFVAEGGLCRVVDQTVNDDDYYIAISQGITEIPEFSSAVVFSHERKDKTFLNVYNFSIQADLTSAIINGGLYLRPRQEGDKIRYGGHTRRLKRLFCDAKIPPSLRKYVPVLCDEDGVVWIPGFGVRDDGGKDPRHILLAVDRGADGSRRFYFGNEFLNAPKGK